MSLIQEKNNKLEIQISAVICDQLIALEFDWLARLGAFARDFNE